jgi:hypothetical protein
MYNHRIIIAGLRDDIIKIFEYHDSFDQSQILAAINIIDEKD